MKRLVLATAVIACLVLTVSLTAEQAVPAGRDADKAPVRAKMPDPNRPTIVTIQYDPGAPQDAFATDDGSGNDVVGNRFTSAAGSPLKSGSLSAVSFFPQVADGNAVISMFGPPTVGGNAANLQTVAVSGVVNSVFNSVGVAQAVGPDFLVGQYLGTFNGPDNVGIRNATTAGQGFHGFQMNFAGGTSTGFTALPGTNAMVRVSGNILIPVELIEFSVD